MWRKKKWLIVAVVAATVVLLAGVIGGAVYAQTGSATGDITGKTLLARVATILGVDQKKVEDAFAQAQREMRDEALSARLKSLVDQGKLTQQQADQYKQWWSQRPNTPELFKAPRGPMRFPGAPFMRGGQQPPVAPTPAPSAS